MKWEVPYLRRWAIMLALTVRSVQCALLLALRGAIAMLTNACQPECVFLLNPITVPA